MVVAFADGAAPKIAHTWTATRGVVDLLAFGTGTTFDGEGFDDAVGLAAIALAAFGVPWRSAWVGSPTGWPRKVWPMIRTPAGWPSARSISGPGPPWPISR
uniref:Uncharacterized protein n=1 Tax=Phenylobacterium glaciei TaxID=2803784 RepID=A0A974P0V2_9CAUL|nr:hypothetical protein JKL49_15325 [Phenylobacterium glaciei]